MKRYTVFLIASLFLTPFSVQANCINEESLLALDASFDRSISDRSLETLKIILHPSFTWVHDHASHIDNSREELLTFFAGVWERSPSAEHIRIQRDIRTLIHTYTGIVFGFTDVSRGGQDLTFNFMRTYVIEDGNCVILSNHTMEIPK